MSLQFDPLPSFVGVAEFTYISTDNDGVPLSSQPATYKIPVVNQPPRIAATQQVLHRYPIQKLPQHYYHHYLVMILMEQ